MLVVSRIILDHIGILCKQYVLNLMKNYDTPNLDQCAITAVILIKQEAVGRPFLNLSVFFFNCL